VEGIVTISSRHVGRPSHRGALLRNLLRASILATLLATQLGTLIPTARAGEPTPQGVVDQAPLSGPIGSVVEAKPAPITTPAGGGAGPASDPTIGGPRLFVPYTPPNGTEELADRRSQQSRTLANPDGTFTLEMSDGPINYQDAEGAWQPIDLSLVADEAGGYKVAATEGLIRLDTTDGAIGSIELDGHHVSLSAPGYASGVLGTSEPDANKLTFTDALGTAADVWVRPIDIGLEFGAAWADVSRSPVVSFVLEPGDLTASVAKDGRSILLVDADGKFSGRIDQPIVREGSEDGPPLLDVVSVQLVQLGTGDHLLTYSLDRAWFEAKERVFPILLDPTWCIGQGASGCDANYTSGSTNYDTFIFDANPNSYEIGWTVLRTGFDVRTDEGTYDKMRSLLHFQHVGLPDGAVIYDTDLQTRVCCTYGNAVGQTVYAQRITKSWAYPQTWNGFNGAYTTTDQVSDTVPASGYMHWDVDAIVHSWYTQRSNDWEADHGFQLKMANEGSGYGEVEFRRYNDGTAAYRPLLTINFTQPAVGIDFDARLGPTYAPSAMVKGQATRLPIVVANKTGSGHVLDKCIDGSDADCWQVGYRWFDGKGNFVASGTADLPANVAIAGTSATFALAATPPSTIGQYTLRLDLVHRVSGTYAWASDYALSSLYYSRNKKVLTADSTRWTGTSVIERDEFSINVTEGVDAGEVVSVTTGAGDELSIDLASKNLSFQGDSGLGFADRLPLTLTYSYNEALAELCTGYQGILGACGWSTNWDERITGGANQTGFDYTYTDSAGTPSMLDTDADGQLAGGAPVLVNRQRVTIIDENGGWDGADAGTVPDIEAGAWVNPAFSGNLVGRAPSDTHTSVNGPDKVSLNTYRRVRFAVRTNLATTAGLCFKVHNLDDTAIPDDWFCYTLGASDWTTGFQQRFISGTILGVWKYVDEDLYDDVRLNGAFGGATDHYQVVGIHVQSSSGSNSGYTYVDGFRFESVDTTILDESNPTWTSGTSSTSTDAIVGSNSIKVSPGSGINPRCQTSNGCWSATAGGMWAYPFSDWYWKKAGGTTAAMVFYLHNERSGARCNASDCTLTYFAGAGPSFAGPAGDGAVIRISPAMPVTWTLVRRNVLEDARQALNLFDDGNGGLGDDVRISGYAPVAVDGGFLLVDRFAYGNLADVGHIDPTGPDPSGALGQRSHPNATGDATFTYDFSADYADGSRHYFNRDGLLTRIRNRDRQAISVDWTFDTTQAGPTAYALTAIHAPGDGTNSGGVTFDRQFTVTPGTDGSLSTIRFDEVVGSTSSDGSGRAVVFERDTTGDLVKVSPTRVDVGTGAPYCGARPNGCVEFAYIAGGSHRLQYVHDPRWDGSSSGTADYRLQVGRSGTDPISIVDRSHSSVNLLKILTFDDTRDTSLVFTRPMWQDAAAAAAGAAILADLNPDGGVLTRYTPRTCTGGDCVTNPPAIATQANYKAVEYEFDGLSRVNSVITYRCPLAADAISGCTAGTKLSTKARSETFASAKVDNYADPLAAGRVAWRADADQVFASLKDSAGTNSDWYRTDFMYDGSGLVSETIEVRQVEASTYLNTVNSAVPYGYWRLNETSGPTMADASGNGRNGNYTVAPTLGGTGALVRDTANKAPTFNGTTQYAKVTNAQLGTVTGSFTVDTWLKTSSSSTVQAWVGSRGPSEYGFEAAFCHATCSQGKGISVDVGSGTAWLLLATIPFDWSTGRWYHVGVAVDDAADMITVYVDGQVIGTALFTTAGTPVLTNATHDLHVAQNGLTSAPHWFNGQVDEFSVYTGVLEAAEVAAHYRAGRAVATVDSTVIRDTAGRPLESASQFVVNPGFEQNTNGWALGSGASISTSAPNSGLASLSTSTNSTTQIVQLVPGQAFRLQLATKASAATTVNAKLQYSDTAGTWFILDGFNYAYTETGWTPRAYDVLLPATGVDGRVRLLLWKTGAGTGYVDDIVLVTNWSSTTYSATSGIALGLPTDTYGLNTCAGGLCGQATVQTQLLYTAGTSSPNYYPAIFPTTVIANRLDGTPGPGPAEDVTTTASFDGWGRRLVSTDPDGVTSTTVYDAANQTDVAQTLDGLGNATTTTYDKVGNMLTTTSPLGRISSATYDGRSQQTTSVAPDGVLSRTDYDDFGRTIATFANYVNGAVESTDGDATDDVYTKPTYDAFGNVVTTEADCGSAASCTANGGLDAKTTSTYDLLGNVVSSTVYPGAGGTGTARVTTNYFDTTTVGSTTYSRTQATGVRLPIAPSAGPASLCPGSSAYCNAVTTLDLSGRAIATTDAYGVVTRTAPDLAGNPVRTIANYGDGTPGPNPDDDVTTTVEYSILGDPAMTWTPALQRDERLYDALGRMIQVSHRDNTGAEYLLESTEYRPSGRVDRTFGGAAWTRTLYDAAGRATRTIANYDPAGTAGMTLEAFESGVAVWSIGSSGFFTTAAAAAKTDDTDAAGNAYHAVAPVSGAGRLHVTTHATSAQTGTWVDLSGPTYQSGHTYKASFDLAASAAGLSLTAYVGQDQSGGSYGSLPITSTTGWTRYTVTWTPAASLSSGIHFALVKPAAGTAELYLDNLVVWDSTAGWADKGIISSVSAYNADGEIRASAVTPGDPATERPLVSGMGFDRAGRGVATTINGASGAYAAAVKGTANLVGYFPVDERTGLPADKTGGASLTLTGAPRLALAGGIDEPRTAVGVGGGAYLSRSSNATPATTNVSLEAWLRIDAGIPSQTLVVAANGTAANGWGLAVDTAGKAAGVSISGSTLTTMSASSSQPINDGRWHHLVLTRGASTWAMTLDGAAQTLTNNTSSPGTPGAGLSIGALSDGSRPLAGEIDEVSVYTADISGATAAAHWAAGRQTDVMTGLTSRRAFDRLGRPTDTWTADLVRTRAAFSRLGSQTETVANYRDGVTSGTNTDDDVRSTFASDVLGELTGYCPAVQVKASGCDPANAANTQAWHYEFDALGRQTKSIPPVNTTATAQTTQETVYETGGQMAKTCAYPAGQSCGAYSSRHVDFTYDHLGRVLTQKTWDRGASPAADTLKFTKTLTWNANGTPATVAEGADTLTYVYDTAARLKDFKRGSTFLTSYTYTAATSTVASRTDGTLGTTTFGYDWARRVTTIDPADSYVAGVVTRSYRLDGLLATQAFPSSLTETLAYDAAKRPISISLGVAGSLSQAFDRAGNVTSDGRSLTGISGDAGTNTQSFAYDGLSRLTGSTGLGINRSYTYDLDGNRLTRVEGGTTTTLTYDRADTAISQNAGAGLFVYDRYGNLTQAPDAANALTTYAYDEASRLKTITPPAGGAAATFTIDPLDRHATRVVSGVTDTYGYTGPTETTFETATTGTRSLLDLDGSRLAVKNGTSVAWVIFDLHGSVAALCPAGGTTLSDAYRYDGWGQKVASAGTSANPWKYRGLLGIAPGSIADQLLDMGARDYAPSLGTFTQLDSVQGGAANPLTMNRFLYALANPATLIDPDGHRPMDACDRDCGSDYDSTNDTKLWQKNQQQERSRQQRVANQRQTTGCRRSGDCTGSSSGAAPGLPSAPPGYHWSTNPMINGEPMLLPDSCIEAAGRWLEGDCASPETGNALLVSLAIVGVVVIVASGGEIIIGAGGTVLAGVGTGTGLTSVTTACVIYCARARDWLAGVGETINPGSTGGHGIGPGAMSIEERAVLNAADRPYPRITDLRTGGPIPFPSTSLAKVPKGDRVPWGAGERWAYIKEWHERGYPTPPGGWGGYDIHHIVPREFGGANAFDNLVPVQRDLHQSEFTAWWRNYR
jgi:RHS repeat-associated protein